MHFVLEGYFLSSRKVTQSSGANDEIVTASNPQIYSHFTPDLCRGVEIKNKLH